MLASPMTNTTQTIEVSEQDETVARKSKKQFKGFGDPPKARKKPLSKGQSQGLDELEERVMKGPMASQISGIVRNPEGEVKMSEVLEAFVQAYVKFVKNYQQRLKLLGTAALA